MPALLDHQNSEYYYRYAIECVQCCRWDIFDYHIAKLCIYLWGNTNHYHLWYFCRFSYHVYICILLYDLSNILDFIYSDLFYSCYYGLFFIKIKQLYFVLNLMLSSHKKYHSIMICFTLILVAKHRFLYLLFFHQIITTIDKLSSNEYHLCWFPFVIVL